MPKEKDKVRGFAAGGDEAHLAHYTTAHPVAGTIVRRDENGFVRADGIQIVNGLVQIAEDNLLLIPIAPPDPDTFLTHTADGILAWLPPAAFGGTVDWSQIVYTPVTLAGYGIQDAYTKSQIANFFDNISFSDTGFGNPIGGIAVRGQLPSTIAYEDEANVFTNSNTFTGPVEIVGVLEDGKIVPAAVPDQAIAQYLIPDKPLRMSTSQFGGWGSSHGADRHRELFNVLNFR